MYRISYLAGAKTGRLGLLIIFTGLLACQFVGIEKETSRTDINVINSDSLEVAFIMFDETEHNFGRVYEGEQVGWFFKFKNTGTRDLLITNAYASCGCTVPDYKSEPVHPGSEGVIKVIFDTRDRTGIQTKTITVESNAHNKIITLNIKAEIINK